MLDRLEPADRPLELLAHLCIGRRHVARRVGGADGIGGGKDLKMERRVRVVDSRNRQRTGDPGQCRRLVERRRGWRRLADLEMPQGAAEEAERMCRSLAIEEARDRKSTRLNSSH